MLETLSVLTFGLLLFTGLVSLGYRSAVTQYAGYRLEEALLCAARPRAEQICQASLRRELIQSVLFNEQTKVQLTAQAKQVQGRVDIFFGSALPFFQKLELRKKISLPLEKNE